MPLDNVKLNIERSASDTAALYKHGFKLTNKLGQGGYGKVYLAEYTSNKSYSKHKLACKIIQISKHNTKLPQELKIITKISHPHIIEIHSVFQRKDKFFIFMRYAEYGDLLEYILKEGPVKESLAKLWIRQLSLAIQYLHLLEIAHRDIKCENILITKSNHVKLADFGFSRIVVDTNFHPLLSETYCGSVSYASPQILTGQPYLPKATDMWSLGCVIYVMLNKAFPFDAQNMKLLINDQYAKNYKFRTKYINRYDKEIIELVSGLLEPKEKYRLKIDDVISCYWITKDSSLRMLTAREFSALENARRLITDLYSDDYQYFTPNSIRQQSWKHRGGGNINDGFDLDSIKSSIITHRRLST